MKSSGSGAPVGVPSVDATLCNSEGKRVESSDLNRDNKPDVWKIYKTTDEGGTRVEVMTCRQVDYDHDGRKDHVITFDDSGTILTEEFDFDYDGVFDARYHYGKGGKVTLVERDSDHDKKPDVWEKYDADGQLETVQRDRNGDGKPDLWENYQGGELITILYDDNYDQQVDRKEEGPPSTPAPGGAESPAEPAPG